MNLSASHRHLDLDLLEQISVGAHSVVPEILADAAVRGVVVLATCNRFEVYLDAQDEARATRAAVSAIAAAAGIDVADALARLRVVTAGAAVEHLFSVAAGLDSMVVGEREVAGQVRRALEQAHAAGTTSSDLEALFQGASRVSRAVARRTGLADAGRSVVAVALDEAEARRPLAGARVLLVGTGSYAGASVAALRERGAASVVVYSPSGRARQFAASHGLEAAAPGGLDAALVTADVVVACSGSSGSVVDVEAVRRARLGGRGPSVLVDLALRRDIDPAVAQEPGVHLVDLAEVARHAPAALDAAVADGRVIVQAETARLLAVLAERDAAPAVRAVRDHVEAALAEVAARYPDDPQVQRALHQFAASLLHQPVNRARSYARLGRAPDFEAALGTFLGVAVEQVATEQPTSAPPSSAPPAPQTTSA